MDFNSPVPPIRRKPEQEVPRISDVTKTKLILAAVATSSNTKLCGPASRRAGF